MKVQMYAVSWCGDCRAAPLIDRYTRAAHGPYLDGREQIQLLAQGGVGGEHGAGRGWRDSRAAAEAIATKASFSVKRIQEIEAEVKHDVIAFTTAVAETLKAQGWTPSRAGCIMG
jgi:adenylosuccinate lyase